MGTIDCRDLEMNKRNPILDFTWDFLIWRRREMSGKGKTQNVHHELDAGQLDY